MDLRNQATAEAIGEHNRGAESIRDRSDDRARGPSVALHLNVRLRRFAIITAVKHEIRGDPSLK